MKTLLIAAALALTALAGASSSALVEPAHRTVVRGHPLYFEIHGDWHGATQRPLLLLHGGGSDVSESFSQQLAAFAATRRIIAPEQVGQGHSPDIEGPLSYREMMEDTAALLMQLKLRDVDVVGWSDGGIIGLMLAANYPQLVHSIVVSGVNIAPDGLQDNGIAELRSSTPTTGLARKLRELWINAPTHDDLNIELLHGLHKPVLVMAGDHDAIKLSHTQKIYRALPQARMEVLADTGHDTFAQRPQRVNSMVLDFLAQN